MIEQTHRHTHTHELTVAVIAAESKTHCMWAVQNLKPAAIGHVCSRKEENQNRNRKQSSKPRQLLDLTWIYHAPAVPVVQTKLRRKLHWVSVIYLWNQWTQLHLLKFLGRNKYLGGACRPAKNRVFVANLPLPRWIIFAHIQTVPGVYPQSSADQLAFLQSAAELPMIGRDFLHIFKISWLYTSGSGLQRKCLMQPRFQRQLFFANLKPFEEISDIWVEYIHIILIYIISIRIFFFIGSMGSFHSGTSWTWSCGIRQSYCQSLRFVRGSSWLGCFLWFVSTKSARSTQVNGWEHDGTVKAC